MKRCLSALFIAVILCGALCSCSLPVSNNQDNEYSGDSSMFTIKVTSTDPKFAEVVIEAYNNNIVSFMEMKEKRENVISLNTISRNAKKISNGFGMFYSPTYQTSAQYEAMNFAVNSDGDIARTTTSSYIQERQRLVKDCMMRVKSDELVSIVLEEVRGYYDEATGTYPYLEVTTQQIKDSVSTVQN